MDFRHLVASPESLSKVDADALILIVQGSALDAALEAPLAALIDDAVKAGDFELKSGRTLYVHRPPAMKVARLLVERRVSEREGVWMRVSALGSETQGWAPP